MMEIIIKCNNRVKFHAVDPEIPNFRITFPSWGSGQYEHMCIWSSVKKKKLLTPKQDQSYINKQTVAYAKNIEDYNDINS